MIFKKLQNLLFLLYLRSLQVYFYYKYMTNLIVVNKIHIGTLHFQSNIAFNPIKYHIHNYFLLHINMNVLYILFSILIVCIIDNHRCSAKKNNSSGKFN